MELYGGVMQLYKCIEEDHLILNRYVTLKIYLSLCMNEVVCKLYEGWIIIFSLNQQIFQGGSLQIPFYIRYSYPSPVLMFIIPKITSDAYCNDGYIFITHFGRNSIFSKVRWIFIRIYAVHLKMLGV